MAKLTVNVRPLYPLAVTVRWDQRSLALQAPPAPVRVLDALVYTMGGAVDNAAVNTAIGTDPAATRTALELGTAAQAASTDFEVAGAAAAAQAAAIASAQAYTDSAVTGLFDDRGSYDASSGLFPTTSGSGAAGTVVKGDVWLISVAGTLGTRVLSPGDAIRAMVDAPGQVEANWAFTENNLDFAPEPAQTVATQAEAEAGVGTSIRSWSPVRIWQAIAAKLAAGTWISGATNKATPVDADTLPLADSAAANVQKSTTWANVKAALKTYFDTLYAVTNANVITAIATDPAAVRDALGENIKNRWEIFIDFSAGGASNRYVGPEWFYNGGGTGNGLVDGLIGGSWSGSVKFNMGTTATGRAFVGTIDTLCILGNGEANFRSHLQLASLSDTTDTYVARIGFIDATASEPTDGVYFRYTDGTNSGKWEAVCRSSGTETAADTGITAVAGTDRVVEITVNAAGTSVDFSIDGTVVKTITTNIPTGASRYTGVGASCIRSAGTATKYGFILDYLYARIDLTTAR